MRSAGKLLTVVLVAALALSSLAFVACGDIVLSSITAECSVTEYYAGDDFDESSVTVTAHYSDGSSRTVAGWTARERRGSRRRHGFRQGKLHRRRRDCDRGRRDYGDRAYPRP